MRAIRLRIYKGFDKVVQDKRLPYSLSLVVWYLSLCYYFYLLLHDDWRLARNWAVFRIEKALDSPKWRNVDRCGRLKT